MDLESIIAKLPYEAPFLFVDELLEVNEEGVKGFYTYHKELDFYKGHFKEFPVTPGVILTETMAQIGLVCLGIYLTSKEAINSELSVALTSTNIEFMKPVFPGEKVIVHSEKMYFRFGKLKCKVKMINKENEIVSSGEIAGMLVPIKNE